MKNIKYLAAGIFFGIVLVKAEVISWFRIQEMFQLTSFHMYGVIGTAVITGIISLQLIKRFHIKTIGGAPVVLSVPPWQKVQSVRQPAEWQVSQDTPAVPPERSAPWHSTHDSSWYFAAIPWTVGSA